MLSLRLPRVRCRENFLVTVLLLMSFALSTASAATRVTLEWDANSEPDVAGYRLQYGTAPGTYDTVLDVGAETSATIYGIQSDKTYYITVTAYDTAGLESAPSNEVEFQSVNEEPSVIFGNLLSGAQFNHGNEILLQANAVDPDGSISRVEFYAGTTKLGESTHEPFTLAWKGAEQGNHAIQAVVYDDEGAVVRSEEIPVVVTALSMGRAEHLDDGSFQISVAGAIGRTNRVYASEDLKKWELIATEVNTEGSLVVTDEAAAGKGRRFYKVEAE